MSSLSAKDRVSLCSFPFSDGRRCRSPRDGKQSHFCFDHAEKEAQARAADNLGKDLAYFFSGDYLSEDGDGGCQGGGWDAGGGREAGQERGPECGVVICCVGLGV